MLHKPGRTEAFYPVSVTRGSCQNLPSPPVPHADCVFRVQAHGDQTLWRWRKEKRGDGEFMSQIEKTLLCCTNHSRKKTTSSKARLTIMEVLISRTTHSRRAQLSSLWHFHWAHRSAFARGASYSWPNECTGKTSKQKTAAVVGKPAICCMLDTMKDVLSHYLSRRWPIDGFSCEPFASLQLLSQYFYHEHWWNRPKQHGTQILLNVYSDLPCCSSGNARDFSPVSRFPSVPYLHVSFIVWPAYLSLKVKGQAGDPMGVDILQNGHCLRGVGVPHTNVRLLPHLSGGHQHTFRMQG